MERSDIPDLGGVIARERESRRTLITVRQLIRQIAGIDPATFSPEEWREKAVGALKCAESALQSGLATSKTLKGIVATICDDEELSAGGDDE